MKTYVVKLGVLEVCVCVCVKMRGRERNVKKSSVIDPKWSYSSQYETRPFIYNDLIRRGSGQTGGERVQDKTGNDAELTV